MLSLLSKPIGKQHRMAHTDLRYLVLLISRRLHMAMPRFLNSELTQNLAIGHQVQLERQSYNQYD